MSRTWVLTRFLVRELFASLAGIAPLGAALAFGLIAFEYGMDQAQFITVGGVGTGAICFLTSLLLAGRADRAASYPLLARLRWRSEFLGAIVLGALGITSILAVMIAAANLLAGRLALTWPSLLWILPTWLAFWLFAATLALSVSLLVSRDGSNLLGYVLIVGILVAHDRKAALLDRGLDWAVRVVERVLWPAGTLFARASAGIHNQTYLLALGLTLAYMLICLGISVALFRDKDLLWSE
jgi:hypothetical protein